MKRLYLSAFIILLLSQGSYAQLTTCAQTLRLANSTYEQGRLHELPDLLAKCLENGFDKQEKVQAYKLLALTYIYLEEPEKADEMMLKILQTDNYFTINKDIDPAEFIALYNTFRTKPVYRLGVKFSMNVSQPNVSQFNPISDGNAKYTYKLGVGAGVAAEIPINLPFFKHRATFAPELYYLTKSFTNQTNSVQLNSVYATSTGKETQNWISVPVMLQYRLFDKDELESAHRWIENLNPYVSFGVSGDYLLGASTSVDQKRVNNQSIDLFTENISPQRMKFNLSVLAGAGIKSRVGKGFIIGEVRYAYGLTKVNSQSTLFSNQLMLNNYKLVDGVFSLNSLFLNVGYVQNFFNPKKLKRK
ncbi:MAG: PorT family protein [Bacteroidetes bacterium]|nr:PorT family protein [Bacteroidota bacterium]MBS1541799.1 PorT family protein [Bacteroidota bacterium]